jgi:transcriptional regulator with XRE-family HTH domain
MEVNPVDSRAKCEEKYVIDTIKKIRAEKHISQFELAERANLSQGFLASLESGKKAPSLLTFIKIAYGLEVNPCVFFSGFQPSNNAKIKENIIKLVQSLL